MVRGTVQVELKAKEAKWLEDYLDNAAFNMQLLSEEDSDDFDMLEGLVLKIKEARDA